MKKNLITEIKETMTTHQASALTHFHRLPIVISANSRVLCNIENEIVKWHSNTILIQKNSTLKANDIIGHEYDAIIYHLDGDVNPNLFAAISGTLKAGGAFILLCELNSNHSNDGDNTHYDKKNAFFRYLLSSISKSSCFLTISINDEKLDLIAPAIIKAPPQVTHNHLYSQQEDAISLITKVLTGHRRRPLTLTADRGRGKSAAIGIAIGRIIQDKIKNKTQKPKNFNIFITAPSLHSASVIFKHIKQTLPSADIKNGSVTLDFCHVNFIAANNLIHQRPQADLLIVEEAAGHNLNILNTLLTYYSRIVFATTLHGYEGSGQGFVTRFSKTLDSITPNWKSFTLNQPIRWAASDPLENFIDRTFLLTQEAEPKHHLSDIDLNKLSTQIIHNKTLIEDVNLIASIFYLLKSAHYKTSPNDLRQLMNAESSIVFASYYQDTLVAAAIVEKEGNIPIDLANEIYCGTRRPKGQLIPQSIIMHLGLKQAAQLQYLRIMRIAVRPDLQRNKIGSHLLTKITDFAKQKYVDCIGTSFGATPELLHYWLSFGFHTLRLGYKKNTFSGCHAALLLLPISDAAKKMADEADDIFLDNFIAQLPSALNNVEPNIISTLLNTVHTNKKDSQITQKTRDDVYSFVHYNRSYDDNLASILSFVIHTIKNIDNFSLLNESQRAVIILKILQNKSWPMVCEALHFKGKKQAAEQLKKSLSLLI